ncbi:MAG: hypothetical protein ABH836_00700 [Candidatus Omnitrophota bacterium]
MSCFDNRLKTQHKFTDWLYWNSFILLPIIIACTAIGRYSVVGLVFYIFVVIAYFFIIMYRFFCAYCPHYLKEENVSKCMFYWGLPKYFKRRTQSKNIFDEIMVLCGAVVLGGFPVYWLVSNKGLLVAYCLSWMLFLTTMKRYECPGCIYFNCPFNNARVIEKETR